jgi:hypothetical protein
MYCTVIHSNRQNIVPEPNAPQYALCQVTHSNFLSLKVNIWYLVINLTNIFA